MTERLIQIKYNGIVSRKREEAGISCSTYCDLCSQGGGNCEYVSEMIKKLAAYETAEDEGRLVVLPCKAGDTVWMVHQRLTSTVNDVISKMTVTELRGNRLNPIWFVIDGEYGRTSFHPSEIGKTVFLTREEAEKALKEMEGKLWANL